MESSIFRILVTLGVPGVALGVFYLLLKSFNFQFSQVSTEWTAIIAILFLLIIGIVTTYALHLWAPRTRQKSDALDEPSPLKFVVGEETITYTELMRSRSHDVVKVHAHTHQLGVGAEYFWIQNRYPRSEHLLQQLEAFTPETDEPNDDEPKIYFDVMTIRLECGRDKKVYFDISDFFHGTSSFIHPERFIESKLKKLYS